MSEKEEYNNPFDKNAPREKYLPQKFNDWDLYEIAFRARQNNEQKSSFVRYRLDLPSVQRGARKGNKNAEKSK